MVGCFARATRCGRAWARLLPALSVAHGVGSGQSNDRLGITKFVYLNARCGHYDATPPQIYTVDQIGTRIASVNAADYKGLLTAGDVLVGINGDPVINTPHKVRRSFVHFFLNRIVPVWSFLWFSRI